MNAPPDRGRAADELIRIFEAMINSGTLHEGNLCKTTSPPIKERQKERGKGKKSRGKIKPDLRQFARFARFAVCG